MLRICLLKRFNFYCNFDEPIFIKDVLVLVGQ